MTVEDMTVEDIVNAIRNGDADGHEKELYAAIKARYRALGAARIATVRLRDRVRIGMNVTPRALRGATGTVTGFSGRTRFIVTLDTPMRVGTLRRYISQNGEVTVPATAFTVETSGVTP